MTGFEQALSDYYKTKKPFGFPVATSLGDVQDYEAAYFFRGFDKMPEIEQQALLKSKAPILDVGAGVGAHALWFQEKNLEVDALEISKVLCDIMQKSGVKSILNEDVFSFSGGKYQTILLLMNGIGIAGSLTKCEELLLKLKSLLLPGGSIFIDSADIIDLVEGNPDDYGEGYYGEIEYQINYKNKYDQPFPWLFIDFDTLAEIAEECGLKPKLVLKGSNNDFLAELSI